MAAGITYEFMHLRTQEADTEPGSMGPMLSGWQVAGTPEGSSPAHFLPAPAHQGHPDSAS